MYKVDVGPKARKFIRKQNKNTQQQIIRKLRELEKNHARMAASSFKARKIYTASALATIVSSTPSKTINCSYLSSRSATDGMCIKVYNFY